MVAPETAPNVLNPDPVLERALVQDYEIKIGVLVSATSGLQLSCAVGVGLVAATHCHTGHTRPEALVVVIWRHVPSVHVAASGCVPIDWHCVVLLELLDVHATGATGAIAEFVYPLFEFTCCW